LYTFIKYCKKKKIGEINLRILTPVGLTNDKLWKRDFQHGDVWVKAHIDLNPNTNLSSYKLVFEALVGKSYNGDASLDEIVFIPNQSCPPISEQGDIVTQYCDFEADTCSYSIDGPANYKWKRVKGKDNTLQTNQGTFLQIAVI
jgi:hypothetical protein